MALGAGQLNLVIVQTAQAVGDGGNTLAQHRGIRNDKRIRFKLFFAFLDKIPEADAANFFFAFDEDFYIDGELAVHLLQGGQRFQVDVNLALVVGGTATEEITVANCGFESGRSPEIERLGGVHGVMAVKKDGGLARSFQRFRVDQRVEICRDDLNVFEAGRAEVAGNPIGAALDIGFVFTLGANAGDAQEFAKLRKVLVTGRVNKVSKIHMRDPQGTWVLSRII